MIICDVLTGFLGSGKTTLLNALLRDERYASTAVIVNEFGEIGIDQLLYKEVAENVYLLDSGCLCCTLTNSLRETLLSIKQLAEQMNPPGLKRVVVETTGLADPLPILHVLLGDRVLTSDFRLGQVVVTVDAAQGLTQLAAYPEALRQVSVADHLVMTKTDLAEEEQVTALGEALQKLNPRAPLTRSVQGEEASSIFANDDATQESKRSYFAPLPKRGGTTHDSAVSSWSSYIEARPTWSGVSAWWNLLIHRFGDGLLRCKGLLHMDDARPYVLIQGVGKVFHTPQYLDHWPDNDPRSRIVCIGLRLDENWLRQSLDAFRIKDVSSLPQTLDELKYCF